MTELPPGMLSEEEFLAHFGVKGMKWGKTKERSSERTVLTKGTSVMNLSAEKERSLNNGHVYGAFTPKDILDYRVNYSWDLKMKGVDKIFNNAFEAKKNLTVASEKEAYDAFKKVYEANPEKTLRALAIAKKDMDYIAAIRIRILNQDADKLDEKYYQSMKKKGSEWMTGKRGYERYVSSLAISDTNRTSYFKELGAKGVDAIIDRNDIRALGTEKPLLIFNGSKSLKKVSSVELTYEDVSLAAKAFNEM